MCVFICVSLYVSVNFHTFVHALYYKEADWIYALIWSPGDMTDMFLAVFNTKKRTQDYVMPETTEPTSSQSVMWTGVKD